jgi:hypothetical protein
MSLIVVLLAGLLSGAPQQSGVPVNNAEPDPPAQTRADDGSTQASPPPAELPVSLKRIQRALSKPPAIRVVEAKTRGGRPIYRVDVEGERIDIARILGRDSLRAPAPYGGMTHSEFLDLVTPTDVRGYAAFSNGQGMMVAATSIALQWAVLKALDSLKAAKDERAKEKAQQEVEEALEALRRARRAAGLPDK